MSTVAIHAIWTTYMTWPPGDPRGHWSALFDLYGRLIERGHKLNLPDRETLRRATELAKEQERVLTPTDQQIVADTIGEVLRNDLEGRVGIYAAAIERTHIHLLFDELDIEIDKLVGRVKSRTSSAVIKKGSDRDRTRTWTTGYWKVFVFEEIVIPEIQRYIEDHNVRRGLVRAPFKWITPYR